MNSFKPFPFLVFQFIFNSKLCGQLPLVLIIVLLDVDCVIAKSIEIFCLMKNKHLFPIKKKKRFFYGILPYFWEGPNRYSTKESLHITCILLSIPLPISSIFFFPICCMTWTQLRTLIPASLSFKEDCGRFYFSLCTL